MNRIQFVLTLTAGMGIGLLCGTALTVAHGDPPKFDGEQVVAQVGQTKITRGQLAQYALTQVGNKILDGQIRDTAIIAEAARRENVIVTADEVNQRIDESLKYAMDDDARKRMEAIPRWILIEQIRPMMQLEKLTKINLTEDDLQNFFDSNSKVFIHPAKVKLVCIATNVKEDAREALARLKTGEDPRAVSAALTADADLKARKGDLGWVDRSAMTPGVDNAIFKGNDGTPLKPKQYTDIIVNTNQEGQNEYLIFYIDDFQPGARPSFEQVKDAVRYYARVQKVSKLAPEWFIANIKTIQWQRLKDLADPQSEMITVPINENDFRPKETPASTGSNR